MNVTLEEYKTAIAHYEEQLTLEAAKLEQSSQAQREEFQTCIDESKARIAAINTDLASVTAVRDRLTGENTTADQQEAQANNQVETLQRRVQDITEEIAASSNQEHDRLAAFGLNMTAVLTAIKNGHWFGDVPVGPLGLYVELEEAAKWGDIMRISIGHQMRAFAITDARDFGPLKSILQRYKKYVPLMSVLYCYPLTQTSSFTNQIIVSENDVFDYHNGEPPPAYLTPLRTLKVRSICRSSIIQFLIHYTDLQ